MSCAFLSLHACSPVFLSPSIADPLPVPLEPSQLLMASLRTIPSRYMRWSSRICVSTESQTACQDEAEQQILLGHAECYHAVFVSCRELLGPGSSHSTSLSSKRLDTSLRVHSLVFGFSPFFVLNLCSVMANATKYIPRAFYRLWEKGAICFASFF